MGKYLMIADDFTGSGDAGVQMSKRGVEAHIIFDLKNVEPDKSYVIDSESRNIPPNEAYNKIRNIFEDLKDIKFDYYYKKIDSTIRGNIRSEILAADSVYKPDLIVFNPANPDSNRTVIDGVLYMNGTRVCETEIMRDPLCLVTDDNLVSLMEDAMEEPVQYFNLTQIRQNKLKLNGARVITYDVLENSDMEKMVSFLLGTGKKILWVGSAGMANALFSVVEKPKPVLALVGSIAETSRRQVKKALDQGAELIEMNVKDLINGGNLQDVAGKVIEILRTGNDAVVVSAKENEDYIAAVDCGKKHGMSRQDVARYTQEKMGELSRLILKEVKVQGVFLTGGDTAISFMKKNGASGARLIEDVLPVIALIELDGGDYPNLPCIVKGGSIGNEDALVKCIQFFHNK